MTTSLRLVRRSLSAALLLALAGTGCTDEAMGVDQPDVDPEDTTAPAIQSTLPAAMATGVASTSSITVTFSEQMDPATVEAAYASTDLPFEKVSFQWNPALTVLTISPDAPLEYAEGTGTDPASVPAKPYSITIGATAKDLAGNALGQPLELRFATKRRLVAAFAINADLSRVVRDTTVLSVANPMWIGDNNTGGTYRSYLTFDLATLPAGSEIESATFGARQLAPSGTPYSLGAIMAQHVTFDSMTGVSAVQAISLPGSFSADPILETKTIDVSSQVKDDVINRAGRGHRSQYRLQIDQATDADGGTDTAVFAKDTFELTAVYVVD